MPKLLPCLAALAFLPAIPPGMAVAQHVNAADAPCRGVVQTAELTACLRVAAKKSDLCLNQLYGRIGRVLDAEDRQRLQTSERAWLKYRDAFCDAEYRLYGGGSGGPPARSACIEALTRHHSDELQAAYGWRVEKFAD